MISIKLRHLPVVLAVVLVAGFAISLFISETLTKKINDVWLETYDNMTGHQIEHLLEGETKLLEATLSDLLYDKQVIELFKVQDREGLKVYLQPFYENYKKHGIEFVNFINPDLKSFLRMHSRKTSVMMFHSESFCVRLSQQNK